MSTFDIIAIVVIALVLIGYVAMRIFRKDYLTLTSFLKVPITVLASAIKGLGCVFPNAEILSVLDVILNNVISEVTRSEKLWLDGEIEKYDRNVLAKQYIYDALQERDILVTPAIEAIIDGAIAAVCYLLPHYEADEEPEDGDEDEEADIDEEYGEDEEPVNE